MSNQALYDGRMMAWACSIRCDRALCSTAAFVTVGTAASTGAVSAGVPSLVSPISSSSCSPSPASAGGPSGASRGLSETGAEDVGLVADSFMVASCDSSA